jgi:hypothetical protein
MKIPDRQHARERLHDLNTKYKSPEIVIDAAV